MPRGEAAAAADVSKVREGREVVVADLREVRRDGERAAVEVVERVAVVRRARHGFHRHAAGVAGPVFEDERLPEERLEPARERAGAGLGGPAGQIADEEPDRLVGIALRERRRDRADAQADDARCPEHPSSPPANRASNRTSSRYYKRLSKRSTRTESTVSWELDFAPSPPIIDRHGAAAATSGSGI